MIKFNPYKFDPIISNKLIEFLCECDEEAPPERIENAITAIQRHMDERKSKKLQFLAVNGLFMLVFLALTYLIVKK